MSIQSGINKIVSAALYTKAAKDVKEVAKEKVEDKKPAAKKKIDYKQRYEKLLLKNRAKKYKAQADAYKQQLTKPSLETFDDFIIRSQQLELQALERAGFGAMASQTTKEKIEGRYKK